MRNDYTWNTKDYRNLHIALLSGKADKDILQEYKEKNKMFDRYMRGMKYAQTIK